MADDTNIVSISDLDEDKKIYLKSIFDKYDLDGNGKIDINELMNMLKEDGNEDINRKIVKKLIKYSDRDNDGKVNVDEFITMVHDRNFKQLFGKYVSGYVNFIVPPNKRRPKFKPVGRNATTEVETDSQYEVEGPYEESFSCWPPPLTMVFISLVEIACFVADEVTQPNSTMFGNGVTAKVFIYDPYRRQECWRFLTYMFVHIGYVHLIVNLLIQILLGLPLELVNEWWRVITVYFAGVVAGSLITSIVDPVTYLAGASGGVYAIITAHLANITMNWKQMSYPGVQLFIFLVVITTDVATAIHNRYYYGDQNIGYAAHFGGAIAGLLVGIWMLKNLEFTEKEKYLWWAALIIYILLMGAAVMLNIFWSGHFLRSA